MSFINKPNILVVLFMLPDILYAWPGGAEPLMFWGERSDDCCFGDGGLSTAKICIQWIVTGKTIKIDF